MKFCQHFVWLGDLPSTSANFHASGESSFNFCQVSVWPANLPSTLVYILCCRENFRQLYMQPENLMTTSRAASRPSVNLCLLSLK